MEDILRVFSGILKERDSFEGLKEVMNEYSNIFRCLDRRFILAILAEIGNKKFKEIIETMLNDNEGKEYLDMWKAFKEYEDSVARQHANTKKRLTVRLNESEKNRKVAENKLKRCEAKLETVAREMDEQLAKKDEQIADKDQTIRELKRHSVEAERSRFEEKIFSYIRAGLNFKVQRDLIIFGLTENYDLTRYEAGEYYNDFVRCNEKVDFPNDGYAIA